MRSRLVFWTALFASTRLLSPELLLGVEKLVTALPSEKVPSCACLISDHQNPLTSGSQIFSEQRQKDGSWARYMQLRGKLVSLTFASPPRRERYHKETKGTVFEETYLGDDFKISARWVVSKAKLCPDAKEGCDAIFYDVQLEVSGPQVGQHESVKGYGYCGC